LVDALLIQSDSDCPSPFAVHQEVQDLTTPAQRAAAPPDARVVISDQGERIAVAITRDGKTAVRVYEDAARDCARRAHFTSVLAVIALMPPDIEPETKPEPEATPQPETKARAETKPREAKPEPAVSPRVQKRVRLELGGVMTFSTPISDTVRAVSPGAMLGVALGAGMLRVTLLTEYAPPISVDYTGASAGRAELERLDMSVGARLSLSDSDVASSIELSALASRAEVVGVTQNRPRQDTAFSVGGRAGFHVAFGDRRLLSPFLGVHAKLFPFAPAVTELPRGTVGHLPYLWLGVSAGLALAL
jgi:hypothetical protein